VHITGSMMSVTTLAPQGIASYGSMQNALGERKGPLAGSSF